MSDDTVVDLVRRAREGDAQAEAQLFDLHLQSLLALVRKRISPKLAARFDPEDVVQSAYGSFFGGLGRGQFEVDGGDALWSLLVSITLHKLHRRVKFNVAQKRNVFVEQQPNDDSRWEGLRPELPADAPTPHEEAALLEEVAWLMNSLNALQKNMLDLRLQGYTIDEIAQRTNRSERTVRRLMERLKIDLEQRLQESSAG